MIDLGRFCQTTSDDHVQIPDPVKNLGSENERVRSVIPSGVI